MPTKRVLVVLLSVVLVAALTAVTVIADPFGLASSEDGLQNFEEWQGSVDTIIGDDPDEPGYTGPIPMGNGVLVPSEGALDFETLPPPAEAVGEVRLDEEIQPVIDAEPQWSILYYDFSVGSTMRPRSSATNWESSGGGCIYPSKGGDLFTLPLNLPEGSRIDYLRLYFYDTNASVNGIAFITSYDGAGGFSDVVSVPSTGSAGFGVALSPYLGHVVDNLNNAYVLVYSNAVANNSIRLCGLRVAYRLP